MSNVRIDSMDLMINISKSGLIACEKEDIFLASSPEIFASELQQIIPRHNSER